MADADLRLQRKKRSRWGADLGDEPEEAPDTAAVSTPTAASELPQQEADGLKSTPSAKRRKSRWGGDKVAAAGGEETEPPKPGAEKERRQSEKVLEQLLEGNSGITPAPEAGQANGSAQQTADGSQDNHQIPAGRAVVSEQPPIVFDLASGSSISHEKAAASPQPNAAAAAADSKLPFLPASKEDLPPALQQQSEPAAVLPAASALPPAAPPQPQTAPTGTAATLAANPADAAERALAIAAALLGSAPQAKAAASAYTATAWGRAAEALPDPKPVPAAPSALAPGTAEDVEMQIDSPVKEAAGSQMEGTLAEGGGAASESQQPAEGVQPSSVPAASEAVPHQELPPQPIKDPCSLVVSSIYTDATEQSLRALFESAGHVVGCKLVTDSDTGKHRGFGFVMMASKAEAEVAVEKLHNMKWGDESLQVSLKLPESSKPAATSAVPAASAALAAPWAAAGSLPPPPGMPAAPPGLPSSLAIAAAYGGYPPYDPYAAYAYYGYYADPYGYAAHADPYAAMAVANGTAAGAAEEDKPPGIEEDEAPPGIGSEIDAATSQAQVPVAAPAVEAVAAVSMSGDVHLAAEQGAGEGAAAMVPPPPPPPPEPPKKEPTVIHVPLKVPEGARKKQEERKKAREEKARQTVVIPLAEPGKQETVNGKPVEGPEGPQPLAESKPAAPLKVQPVVLGTKGSFQEVLARRQAELAALRGGKTAAVGRRQGRVTPPSPPRRESRSPGRQGSRRRRFSRSPSQSRGRSSRSPGPGRRSIRRQSSGRRSPVRSPVRPPLASPGRPPLQALPPPPLVPRSPARSRSRSPSHLRDRLPRDLTRSMSPGSPLAENALRSVSPEADGPRSRSASPARRKEKRRSKEKKEKKEKRKHKKEKKRKHKDSDQAPPEAPEAVPELDSHLPLSSQDAKPAVGWVEVPPEEPAQEVGTREMVLLPPPQAKEPAVPAEPAVFRKPARKRARTRWQPDEEPEEDAPPVSGRPREPAGEQPRAPPARDTRHGPQGWSEGRPQEPPVVPELRQPEQAQQRHEEPSPERKPSPQVSEEGEIPVEEGEIEGEAGELLPEAASDPYAAELDKADELARRASYASDDFREQGGFRGRGRGRARGRGRNWVHSRGFTDRW